MNNKQPSSISWLFGDFGGQSDYGGPAAGFNGYNDDDYYAGERRQKSPKCGNFPKLFCGSAVTANNDVKMSDISTVWNYMNSLMRPPTVLDKLLEYWPQSREMEGRSRRGGKCH